MKQLSGLDSAFLDLEDDHQFLHVSQLLILERPDADLEPYPAWRRQLADRIHQLEPLRRRLVQVPFGLDHPYWIADPDFDLDFHVRHSAVPPPGTDDQLDELVARLVAAPMDREHPLWVSHVIEGLAPEEEGGADRFAILTMIHHSTIDGAAGADLLALMLDDVPDAEPPGHAGEWTSEAPPSTAGVLARAAANGVRRPARGLLLAARAGQSMARASRNPAVIDLADRVRGSLRGPLGSVLNVGRERDPDQDLPRLPPLVTPPTPFNAPVSRYRRFAHRALPLAEVKAVGKEAGATINDVVVALCGGGLRRWLLERGELPDQPLTAMIPVSLREGDEDEPWTNRVSATVAALPTDVDGPVARLRAAHDALRVAKQVFAAMPGQLTPDAAGLGVPATVTAVSRALTRWGSVAPAPFNTVVSNVPGPREPLYLGSATMTHYIPVSAIADPVGLNITVQSYVDQLDIGLLACAELVPDLHDLADAVVTEFDELRAAVRDGG
ncbi:wax ester/triacylglycerol synthase family O-acyltransferase [Actinomycetospora lutea]|uniref:WS/DGAT/MGAT family O-acyltransferase n=1 Tax=Actinomycetospora lutea TaxID=663604 RepID=UPI002366A0AB|nr:wax ester/triacylglycerol synthase family O-acyltransferase [Actinomycetospora lutea]MDD7942528.1 wax ester/triacylglycerol synthase family O-acyltransferase [Actinomycetospora lutea]